MELLLLSRGAPAARLPVRVPRCSAPARSGSALAVECPSCSRTSVNLVTRRHVDVPFYNDRKVGVVEHIFSGDRETTLEAFRAELDSGRFDAAAATSLRNP